MPKWLKSSHCKALRGGGHSSNRLLEPFSPCEEKIRHYERQLSNQTNDSVSPCRAAKLFAMTKKAAFTLLVNALRKNLSFASLRCRFRGFCIPDYRPSAFTLAETLIVLSILGVIAAITVSSLVNNYQKTMNIVKLKKVYAEMTNNINEAMVVNRCTNLACMINVSGTTVNMGNKTEGSKERSLKNLSLLFQSTIITQDTKINNRYKCVQDKARPFNSSTKYNVSQGINSRAVDYYCYKNKIGFAVWNGSFTNVGYGNTWCNTKTQNCAVVYVFLDGNKKDAVLGRNMFGFQLMGDGSLNALGPCDKNSTAKDNGLGCFDYLIKNGWKMDY